MLELSIIGLRSRHQRAPRRIGERSAYFAHRYEFVPISRLLGSDPAEGSEMGGLRVS